MAAFLVIILFSGATGSDELDDYAGLSRRSPILAGTLAVALLSLAGVPPLAGFFGKFMLLRSVALNGPAGFFLLAAGGGDVGGGRYHPLRGAERVDIPQPTDPPPPHGPR